MIPAPVVQETLPTPPGLRLPCAQGNRQSPKRTLTSLCLVLLFAALAHATQMFPLSIEQLSAKADLVLEGSVANRTVQRDAQGRIYTRITLNVRDTWKGQPNGQSFTLVQAGGALGDEIASVDGQEDFSVGEEVVVF